MSETVNQCIVETIGLTVRYNGFTALYSVDLCVRGGSVTIVLGPNGAGKTTLF